MEMSKLGPGPEFDLIRRMLTEVSVGHPLVDVGAGDDCAMVDGFALSTDSAVEGVHFRRDWLSAGEIGYRAVAAAISDLAAIAAEPICVLASLVLPRSDAGDFAQELMRGAAEAARSAGATVAGGDTAKGVQLVVAITAIGKTDAPALRSHARVGDEVWVSGRLGGSAAAVHALLEARQPNAHARTRYAAPRPRISEAIWLRERSALHALLDLSDGLYGDLQHICAASDCGMLIDASAIPVDTDAGASFEQAVSGGEDYELAFTAPAGVLDSLQHEFTSTFGLDLTRIGVVHAGSGVQERTRDGRTQAVRVRGYQHFKS